ncbi:MAG: phosphoglycerate dehydrogenase [Nitrospirae bacterium GWD2_57_9]|nr:MAG: phosphoglycerate dehydrogenase [Nitrospirae bacterium GWD2_57_9]
MKILVTCPPMLGMMDELEYLFDGKDVQVSCPQVLQTMSEEELVKLVPLHDGWIIGDDPATRRVFAAGKAGNLKAAVKWGIGVDNVDFSAAKEFEIPITNTPDMFGREVADVAMSYVVALARETFFIDREVRKGNWPKPRGISLSGKTVGLVGFGDIGRSVARRLLAAEMKVIAYDPFFKPVSGISVEQAAWPARVEECDFLLFTCSLNEKNRHMLNADVLARAKDGVYVVNVARGPLIDEQALIRALETGKVRSAALDVFEQEPLSTVSPLHRFERCIFGSHNGSNTSDAVRRTSERAVNLLFGFLGI